MSNLSVRNLFPVYENFEHKHVQETSSDRTFGLVFSAVFSFVAIKPFFSRETHIWQWPALVFALVFLGASLLRPHVLAPLNKLWTRLGSFLQKITNPIVMGVIFFGICTPIAFVMRLLGRDPLRRKLDTNAQSYWVKREVQMPISETMRNQF